MSKKAILILLIAVSAVVLSVFLFVGHQHRVSADGFVSAYGEYVEAADQQEAAAYLPGAAANFIREKLDRSLSILLTDDIEPKDRMDVAVGALNLTKELELQIDDIGAKRNSVEIAISRLKDLSGTINDENLAEQVREIIELAENKTIIIADIRGLSYSINGETKKIIGRIIAENGLLTDAHIIELNRRIPEDEKRFDRQKELYQQLSDLDNRIEEKYNEFRSSLGSGIIPPHFFSVGR